MTILLVLLSLITNAESAMNAKVSPEVQQSIVELYSDGRCDAVRKKVRPDQYDSLRPNVMAVFAFCDPPGNVAESLFAKAEAREPTGDLIVLLHAKYRWKKNPASAEPLFRKVLMLARHPYMRFMATEYLAGRIEKDEPISLSPNTFYGSAMIGGGRQSNPKYPDLTAIPSKPSAASHLRVNMSAQRWTRWGSMAAIYTLTDNTYFSAHQFDFLGHELDVRAAMRVVEVSHRVRYRRAGRDLPARLQAVGAGPDFFRQACAVGAARAAGRALQI
ncbi:MAG: hypothetical protein HY074_05710 [Deltaproteobacteria bacterium]|nr:hypothetical protein [Deltaproteobacteria bacterium]